jgi:hypothetical protein
VKIGRRSLHDQAVDAGANLGATQANDFTYQADECGQAVGKRREPIRTMLNATDPSIAQQISWRTPGTAKLSGRLPRMV